MFFQLFSFSLCAITQGGLQPPSSRRQSFPLNPFPWSFSSSSFHLLMQQLLWQTSWSHPLYVQAAEQYYLPSFSLSCRSIKLSVKLYFQIRVKHSHKQFIQSTCHYRSKKRLIKHLLESNFYAIKQESKTVNSVTQIYLYLELENVREDTSVRGFVIISGMCRAIQSAST